jgi:hypothetical protein
MLMQQSKVGSVLLTLLLLGSPNLVAGDAEKPLVGRWTLESRTINGQADAQYTGAAVEIKESDEMIISLKERQGLTLKFTPKILDERQRLYRFFVEKSEDSATLGGGGARKGICRINDKGELEILEARSASYDFPADFTDKSKAAAAYWRLTRVDGKKMKLLEKCHA